MADKQGSFFGDSSVDFDDAEYTQGVKFSGVTNQPRAVTPAIIVQDAETGALTFGPGATAENVRTLIDAVSRAGVDDDPRLFTQATEPTVVGIQEGSLWIDTSALPDYTLNVYQNDAWVVYASGRSSNITVTDSSVSDGTNTFDKYTDAEARDALDISHTGNTLAYTDASDMPQQFSPSADLALGTRTATSLPITNDNGTGFTLPEATASLAGLLSAADKTAIDGLDTRFDSKQNNIRMWSGTTPYGAGDLVIFTGTSGNPRIYFNIRTDGQTTANSQNPELNTQTAGPIWLDTGFQLSAGVTAAIETVQRLTNNNSPSLSSETTWDSSLAYRRFDFVLYMGELYFLDGATPLNNGSYTSSTTPDMDSNWRDLQSTGRDPRLYLQNAEPTGTIEDGSIWIDTNENPHIIYTYDADLDTPAWVPAVTGDMFHPFSVLVQGREYIVGDTFIADNEVAIPAAHRNQIFTVNTAFTATTGTASTRSAAFQQLVDNGSITSEYDFSVVNTNTTYAFTREASPEDNSVVLQLEGSDSVINALTVTGENTIAVTPNSVDPNTIMIGTRVVPHVFPENLSISVTPTHVEEDSAGTTNATVTIRESGTGWTINNVSQGTSSVVGVTFGSATGVNTQTVTIPAQISQQAKTAPVSIHLSFEVSGSNDSGMSYSNVTRTVDVRVDPVWFAGVRDSAPTTELQLTDAGVFRQGASTVVTGVPNGVIYVLLPTTLVDSNLIFTTANTSTSYEFTHAGTIGQFTLFNLGPATAGTYTVRIGAT